MANCDFSLPRILVYTSEELETKHRLTGLRLTLNEEREYSP
jgi:hypothetical protein